MSRWPAPLLKEAAIGANRRKVRDNLQASSVGWEDEKEASLEFLHRSFPRLRRRR